LRQQAGRRPAAVNQRDRGPVVPIRDGAAGHGDGGAGRTVKSADEGAPPTTRPAAKNALPAIRLAAILGLLATAALLGVVSATAGLGVAGWIAGLVTGSAATPPLATAPL